MGTMQFRDYIFRHNPARIAVSDPRAVVTHICPGGAEIAQELGTRARVITCSGSFFGNGMTEAMGQLLEFRRKAEGEGMLYLPGLPPFPARLLELKFDAEGDGRIILYTMRSAGRCKHRIGLIPRRCRGFRSILGVGRDAEDRGIRRAPGRFNYCLGRLEKAVYRGVH